MFSQIKKLWGIPELRRRIVFTLGCLVACRIGSVIPVPGVNSEAVFRFVKSMSGGSQSIFELVNVFSGGAFSQMAVFALGVMPYITASIMTQMAGVVFPGVQREMRENPQQGRRNMNRWTRWLTLLIGVVQSFGYAKYVLGFNAQQPGIISDALLGSTLFGFPWVFFVTTIVCMTTGTMILLWIGEQITDKGVGNGASLIIGLGIVASLPTTLGRMLRQLNLDSQEIGELTLSGMFVLVAAFVAIIAGAILIIQGQRNIPLQYARRTVGRSEMQGGGGQLPLKVNYSGVIPVIMASTLLMTPSTIAGLLGQHGWAARLSASLSPDRLLYAAILGLLIMFFTYFWTGISFNPAQIASEMKRGGAFIPGIRQGAPTEQFLEKTMNRVTFLGAIALIIIAILPMLVSKVLGADPYTAQFFGGTSLLIIVGVVLDTAKQIQGHMVMQRYDGFMRAPVRAP